MKTSVRVRKKNMLAVVSFKVKYEFIRTTAINLIVLQSREGLQINKVWTKAQRIKNFISDKPTNCYPKQNTQEKGK